METNVKRSLFNINTEQKALNGLDKPLIRPKPTHLQIPPSPPINEYDLKLESPERSGSPGDQTSRYVALISPATFNLGLKSPNGKKLFAVEIDEKSLLLSNNNNINRVNEDDEVTDVNGNEESRCHQISDKIIIESFEKKLESPNFIHSGISYLDDDSDMSQELEPDSLEDIIIRVPGKLNSTIEFDPSDKLEIILTPSTNEKNYNYSDDETDTPKKELVVPTIVLDRVDVDGKIVNCIVDEMNNGVVTTTDDCVSNIQVNLTSVVQDEINVVETGVQPVIVHVEASQPHKEPKKLFEEDGVNEPEEDEPLMTVKDLEARKLRALERERRRIIDNQVVRRKKIDYWAFANTNTAPPEFSEDQLKALAHEKMGFEALSQVEIIETKVDGSQSPPPTPPPPPPGSDDVENVEIETTQVETRDELREEEDDSRVVVEQTTLQIDVELAALRDEDEREILRSALVTEDGFIHYDEDGMPSLGAVDSASILENKERLRNFWEQRIMADQELKENGTISPTVSPIIVSLDGEIKDSTPTKAKSQEDVFKEAAVLEDCDPSPPDSLNEQVPIVNGQADKEEIVQVLEVNPEPVPEEIVEQENAPPAVEAAIVLSVDEGEEKPEETSALPEKELDNSMEESALDREVRLALEREEQLKKERNAVELSSAESSLTTPESEEQPEDFPVHHVALAPTVEESEEDEISAGKTIETKVSKIVETSESGEVREAITISQTVMTSFETKVQEIIPKTVLTNEPFNDEVVTVGEVIFVDTDGTAKPVEEIVQANKPQIIGETYRQKISEENVMAEIIEIESAQDPASTIVAAPKPAVTQCASSTNNNNNPTSALLKNERPTYNPNSDSKIALEIREMKEREEELRIMRETILRENQNNAANKASAGSASSLSNSSRQSEQGSVHSDDGNENNKLSNGQNGVSGSSSPIQTPITRTISLDNLHPGQPYNIGYAFGHRRKDGVKVKPLADAEEEKQVFKVLKESPIEREIRLTREREEQLKREKGLLQEGAQRPQTLDVTTSNGKLPASKTSPFQVPLKPVNGDTQRIMATSRIQQEIEEQTEREKALRASGKIQTISQERTDAKVAGSRLREVNGGSPDSAVALSSPSHTPLSPSPSLSDSEKSSTHSSPAINGNGSGNGAYVNGVNAKTPSPTNSTVSAGIKVNGNGFQAGRRFSNPPTGRNVNMQRFIASKGKEVTSAFSPFNSASKEKSQSVLSLHHVNSSDSYQMKPPKVPKDLKNGTTANGTSPAAGISKRSLTAESKIQEELKEMQAREDELKQQRARLLGLSQPNLTTLENEEAIDGSPQPPTNGHDHSSTNGSNGVSTLERATSNPNLLDDDVEFVGRNKKNMKFVGGGGGPRRRSTLIEQWEQRIQSSEAKS